jgi:SAM-dependent methyltransferase
MNDHAAHANSFGPAAATYERGRPPYPAEALDWLLEPRAATASRSPLRVLDLGAGTGKLTRQLVARGLQVTAVDPSGGMLAELGRVLPEMPALVGTAEGIPLPDHSADIVLVAQAWHWVDVTQAVPEVARVLAPGGRLGLIWNLRDERTDWVRKLGQIIDSAETHRQTTVGAPFGPVQIREFPWTHRIGRARLLDLVASRSYVILKPPAEREALLDQVRDLMDTDPALAGADEFDMPYITECARADLP